MHGGSVSLSRWGIHAYKQQLLNADPLITPLVSSIFNPPITIPCLERTLYMDCSMHYFDEDFIRKVVQPKIDRCWEAGEVWFFAGAW